jgi:hypothetical protein
MYSATYNREKNRRFSPKMGINFSFFIAKKSSYFMRAFARHVHAKHVHAQAVYACVVHAHIVTAMS